MKNSSNNIMKYLELYCENPSTITAIIRRLFDMPLSAFYGSNTDVILGIRKAYKCLYRFLIEYPAKAFNDEFDLDTVKNKFSFMKGE